MKRDIARGLDDQALAALLHRMFENEQLLCFRPSDQRVRRDLFQHLNETRCFKPTVEQIMLALGAPLRIENGRIVNAEEYRRHTCVWVRLWTWPAWCTEMGTRVIQHRTVILLSKAYE